ncbi:MAG: hypothetical protein WCF92_01865 [bacterium]
MNIDLLERIRRKISNISLATIHYINSNLNDVRMIIPLGTDANKPIVIGFDADDFAHAQEILHHERHGTGSIKFFRSFFGFAVDSKNQNESIYFKFRDFRSLWLSLPADYTDENPVSKGVIPEKNEVLIGRVEESSRGRFFATWGIAPTKDWESCRQIIKVPGELEYYFKALLPVFNDPVWDAWLFATVFDDLLLYKQIRDENLSRLARNAIRSWNPRLNIK